MDWTRWVFLPFKGIIFPLWGKCVVRRLYYCYYYYFNATSRDAGVFNGRYVLVHDLLYGRILTKKSEVLYILPCISVTDVLVICDLIKLRYLLLMWLCFASSFCFFFLSQISVQYVCVLLLSIVKLATVPALLLSRVSINNSEGNCVISIFSNK
jgi:hypothetical protein